MHETRPRATGGSDLAVWPWLSRRCSRLAAAAAPAAALTLIRDAEIEATLGRIADPLFRAAALSPALVDIYIVEDPRRRTPSSPAGRTSSSTPGS